MKTGRPRVLLVDDEIGLRELVRVYLENAGFDVLEVDDGIQAEKQMNQTRFDLVILDIMMPNMDGFTLCRKIRLTQDDLPILLLTAKGEESDRLQGFECGADDYVVKPFSPRELAARAKAMLRRSHKSQQTAETNLQFPHLLIDLNLHYVAWYEQEIILTPKEFSLLFLLARSPRQVFSRTQIMSLAWGENYVAELRIVDVHVKNLREKFNEIGPFYYVQTVWGMGYKFEVPK
ncbi:MAG: response regulator transcription factor [Desulfitobacteriaceae bacterium]|nr:response regulator transcription factor [Desulfitobacteriaceae bacterium]MDI6914023.1 response regulator transcription factor [Desulfitobacteriaceae bacterium]